MIKAFSKIIGVLLGSVLLAGTTFAAGINAGIGAQQYMTKTGVNIVPIVNTYEFGSTTRRWAKGWFTDLDVSGIFTFGGVMGSNLDMDGYNIILDTDGDTAIVNDRDAGILDDEIGINLAGAQDFEFQANTFRALAGSAILTNTLNSLDATTSQLSMQSQTFTPGAAHASVVVSPTYVAEGFSHTGLSVLPTQNGANATELRGINVTLTKATGATTLADAIALRIGPLSVTGTVTNGYGIFIEDQSVAGSTISYGINIASQTANATTTRAMNIAGTGVNNAIRLGASQNLYASAAGTTRLTETTDVNGLVFITTTTSQGIRTVSTTGNSKILLQDNTFTPGEAFQAVDIRPVFATENFEHTGLVVRAAQNGANTQPLNGIEVYMTKATGATVLGTMVGILVNAPVVAGTVTSSFGIDIESQTDAGITSSRAMRIQGTGLTNSIVWGSSALQYANAAENIRFVNSTNANGLDFNLSSTADQTINTVTATTGRIWFQNQTFTPGATHNVVSITPTWTAENFVHRALRIEATQNGANTQQLFGLSVSMAKATAASILDTISAIGITAPTVTGTVTNMNGIIIADQSLAGGTTSYGINIASQTANATTTRAIEIVGTGVNNAIRLGSSPNIYSTGADTIRFSDATVANGFIFTLAATSIQSINTISGTNGEITFQNQTFTAGAAHSAISMRPFWASENFNHSAFDIIPTQNGVNTEELRGLVLTMTKATGATTLGEMIGILLASPSVTGTVTDNVAISILAQGNAGIVNNRGILIGNVGNAASTLSFAIDIASQTASITTSRAIRIIGTGANNAIELGDSPLIYSSGAEVIRFDDSTAARGISFTLTAAGNQTISVAGGGNLVLQPFAGARVDFLLAAADSIFIDAGTTAHTGANVIDMDLNVNSASVNGLRFDIDVPTALSAGEIVSGVSVDINGNAADSGTSIMNGIFLTSANTTTGFNSGIRIEGSWDSAIRIANAATSYVDDFGTVNITQEGNFTGVDTETGIVLRVAPSFTLTEPGAGTFDYYGAHFDVSSIVVTAGAGTTLISALTLTANTDADIGRSRALVLGGTNVQNSIQFGTAATAPIAYSDAANSLRFMDATNARGIDFDLTAAGDQVIEATAGNLIFELAGGNEITLAANDLRFDVGVGVGQFTADGSTGGCVMLRDTDDAGWTEVDALDGVLTASIDADGICD